MDNGKRTLTVLLAIASLAPLAVRAQLPIVAQGNFGNHHYAIVSYGNLNSSYKSWETARVDATTRGYDHDSNPATPALIGHLATISAADENDFLDGLRSTAGLRRPEVWIGGKQNMAHPSYSEPAGGWQWVDNIDIDPTNDGSRYANWAPGEPDNDSGSGKDRSEMYLALSQDGWLDEGNLNNIGGYIIEYTVPIDATTCATPNGCETRPGHRLKLPSNPGAGSTLTSEWREYTDHRAHDGTCGMQTLTLADYSPPLVIPAHFCAFDTFLVNQTTASFLITQGTVLVTHATVNAGFGCAVPVPAGNDPQLQEITLFQTDTVAGMREGEPAENTVGCGSGVGRRGTFSFDVAGMSLYSGYALNAASQQPYPGHSYTVNPGLVEQFYFDLIQDKYALLLQAIAASSASNGNKTKMTQMIDNSRAAFLRRDWANALSVLSGNFIDFLNSSQFTGTANEEGELEWRALNVGFNVGKVASVF